MNNVDHGMSNREKPTAEPNPDRTPPFALDVLVDSEVDVTGGRAAAELDAGDGWSFEVGGDVYSATRDALRTIRRQDNQMLLFEDLMWPDATIIDGGLFTRASRGFGDRLQAAATLRLDLVRAEADTASEFFLENTSADLEQSEANLSGALTLGVGLGPNWTLSLGLGSAVRTADATERYSDRIPATKAQTSAEFMGIAPFRVDLGLRYEDADQRFFAEGGFHGVADQSRVSEMRNEGPTDGYVTLDLRGGVRLGRGFEVRLGVENLTDEEYVNHLNARNPFTRSQIPEPGLVLFWDASYSW